MGGPHVEHQEEDELRFGSTDDVNGHGFISKSELSRMIQGLCVNSLEPREIKEAMVENEC